MTPLSLTVNGTKIVADVEPRTHLADFLRDHLRLTGTHTGCEHGVCGACTLLIDDAPARACIHFAVGCDGTDIRTIEGLADDAVTARLRHAFQVEHGLQCGYCTPGMLVTARDIVLRLPEADDERVRLELAGNLCRCTGYAGIVRAIRRVLDEHMDLVRPALAPVRAARFGIVSETTAVSPVPDQPVPDQPVPDQPAAEGLRQRLTFQHPAAQVWEALHDSSLIAACIPGAQLTAATPGRIEGILLVALGPVRARFGGAATITYNETTYRGTVQGTGQDRSSGTRLNASAWFQVTADSAAACVLVVEVEYGLRGALAQLARGRVVNLLAGEIAAMFARNLGARLNGATAAAPAVLSGGRLLVRVALAWVRRLVGMGVR